MMVFLFILISFLLSFLFGEDSENYTKNPLGKAKKLGAEGMGLNSG